MDVCIRVTKMQKMIIQQKASILGMGVNEYAKMVVEAFVVHQKKIALSNEIRRKD